MAKHKRPQADRVQARIGDIETAIGRLEQNPTPGALNSVLGTLGETLEGARLSLDAFDPGMGVEQLAFYATAEKLDGRIIPGRTLSTHGGVIYTHPRYARQVSALLTRVKRLYESYQAGNLASAKEKPPSDLDRAAGDMS